jgi:hypothetical protein
VVAVDGLDLEVDPPGVLRRRTRPDGVLRRADGTARPRLQRSLVGDLKIPAGEVLPQHLVLGPEHRHVDVAVGKVAFDVERPAARDPPTDRQAGEQLLHLAWRDTRPASIHVSPFSQAESGRYRSNRWWSRRVVHRE